MRTNVFAQRIMMRMRLAGMCACLLRGGPIPLA